MIIPIWCQVSRMLYFDEISNQNFTGHDDNIYGLFYWRHSYSCKTDTIWDHITYSLYPVVGQKSLTGHAMLTSARFNLNPSHM